MRPWKNPAVWVAVSAIVLFWFSDWALGTEMNRDVVDIASIFFGTVMAVRLWRDSIDRFWRGGGQRNWQLLISNEMFWVGWVGFCSCTLISRGTMFGVVDVEWMAPVIGFFKFMILGAGIMSFFATTEAPTPLPATKIYYVAIGVAAGVLIGFALSRLLG